MADKLREYLIGLGFKVDPGSYKKFKGAIASTAKEVVGLGAVTASTATAIALSVEQVAREFEGLFYVSQRTKASVNDLKAYSFGMKQIGIDAGQSAAALDSFTTAMRLNPGVKGFIGLNGGTGRSPIDQLTNFVAQQKKLYGEAGYYVAAMNAELAGIPEATFLQIWNNLPKLRAAQDEMNRMRREAGLSGKEFTDQSVEFANAWDHLLGSIGLGKERIASDFIGPVGQSVKVLDDLVQAFNRADVSSEGFLGKIVGITVALGGTSAALSVALRLLGYGGAAATAGTIAALPTKLVRGGGVGGMALSAMVAMKHDSQNGNTLRTWLRKQLGIEDPGEAAPWAGANDVNPGTQNMERRLWGYPDDKPPAKGGGSRANLREATVAYFMSQGWSRAAAMGIAANVGAESNFNAQAVGDGGAAYGAAQWHPDRQAAFKAFAGKDIRSSTLEEQLAFIQHELTEGNDAGARQAGEKLRGVNSAYDAGAIFSGLYERPADVYGQAHARGKQAQAWYDAPLTPAAGSGASVTINQTNNTTVHGADAAANGEAVKSANDRSNGDLVRNFQGATR